MRTIRKHLTLALVLSACAVAPSAFAQTVFGTKGDVVFSGERLFGFHSTHVFEEREAPVDDYENDWTSFDLGWRGPYVVDFSPYDTPRLGFDYLIIDSLSIGGTLGFASIDSDEDGPLVNDASGTAFLFAPRVGYVYMFNDVIGIWPRGGFNYHSFSVDDAFTESGFGITLECMFPIAPVQHFGFLVGPTLDIDFAGERDYDGPLGDLDRRYRAIGIQAGVFGWL